MLTGIILGSIMTVAGTIGFIYESKKEKKEEMEKNNEIKKEIRNVLGAIDRCRKGQAGENDILILSSSPLGNVFATFMSRVNSTSNPSKWVEGLEEEVKQNLKNK